MHILLANDDGYDAEGLLALARALKTRHRVTIAAPAVQQSGMARAITVHDDVEVERAVTEGDIPTWIIHGTPADCVKIYLEAIAAQEPRPDLIMSGINDGANLGSDVLYSGTVGAAIEGYFHGITSWAVSRVAHSELGFATVAGATADYLGFMAKRNPQMFEGTPLLLNINFPRHVFTGNLGFLPATVGHRDYSNPFTRVKRGGRLYYRMGGEPFDGPNAADSDVALSARGYATVSPLTIDLTDYDALELERIS